MVRMLQETTERCPENPAVIFDGKRITYKDLNRYVEALTRHLQKLGVVKGDKIAIMLGNCPEFVISYFAALRMGAVAVTLNVMSTSYELQHLLGDSEARVLIAAEGLAKRFAAVRKELPLCRHLITTTGLKPGSPFYQIMENDGQPVLPPDLDEEDPAVMISFPGPNFISCRGKMAFGTRGVSLISTASSRTIKS